MPFRAEKRFMTVQETNIWIRLLGFCRLAIPLKSDVRSKFFELLQLST
jgi:hypothetical protein